MRIKQRFLEFLFSRFNFQFKKIVFCWLELKFIFFHKAYTYSRIKNSIFRIKNGKKRVREIAENRKADFLQFAFASKFGDFQGKYVLYSYIQLNPARNVNN